MKTILAAIAAMMAAVTALAGDITVSGVGTVRKQPDKMKVLFTISSFDKDVAEARRMFEERTATLPPVFLKAGIATNEVVTSGMEMSPQYEYTSGKRTFTGYRFEEDYTFVAKVDRIRLAHICASLLDCNAVEELRVRFELFSEDDARNEAKALAVANARKTATILADAANVTLGDVESIVYGEQNRSFSYSNCLVEREAGDIAGASATALRDIVVTESVLVKWHIQ